MKYNPKTDNAWIHVQAHILYEAVSKAVEKSSEKSAEDIVLQLAYILKRTSPEKKLD